ncbi:hypothetical protein RDABS01_016451 [Bienertia sinuspersici]
MKKLGKPRTVEKKMVQVRRSARVANNPAPVYAEISFPRLSLPRKNYGVARSRNLPNRVIATDEVREYTIQEVEKLNSKLDDEGFPTLIRPASFSCYWLFLAGSSKRLLWASLPRDDGMVTLVDEEGDEYLVVYLARKRGLSGGWKGFAEAHQLVDGDAIIFQVINRSILKVYIIRGSGIETIDSD